MKFFRLDLLTLLISLFILHSCKNPDKVGLDVGPDQLNGTLISDTTVILNTEREDSVLVSNLSRAPLAYFNDHEVGLVQSAVITNINLPNMASYTVPEGTITIDSAILALKYDPRGFYGDSVNSVFKVNVHQLAEKPIATASYYNSKVWKYDTEATLGTKTFIARPHDTLKINAIVKGGADTLTRVLPQLRIPIQQNFIRAKLFTNISPVSSNEAFQTNVKGFYITLDAEGTTGTGAIMSFNQSDSLLVYVRINKGTSIDTTIVSLPITKKIPQIKNTYSANVEAALANTTQSNNMAYIQGLGGLRVKVGFPGLKKLPKDSIIINRAELVVTPYPGTSTPFAPLPYLTMYKLDLAKQRTYVEDSNNSSFSALFGGIYNLPKKGEYRFLLTSYIQNLLSGKTKDYGTYISAGNETTATSGTIIIAPTAYPIARTLLAGGNSPYKVKLNIIYTRTK